MLYYIDTSASFCFKLSAEWKTATASRRSGDINSVCERWFASNTCTATIGYFFSINEMLLSI